MFTEIANLLSILAKPFRTQAKTLKSVEAIEADLKALHAAISDQRDTVRRIADAQRHSASTVSFYDDAAFWSSFCGERYVARNPTFALEVPWTRVAGGSGQWRLRADPDRVRVWAQRLSDDGPAAIEVIFMIGGATLQRDAAAELSANAIDNVIRFIFLMRAVRQAHPQSDFGRIKVFLVAAPRTSHSVFVGQRMGPMGIEEVGITYPEARDPMLRSYALHDPRPLIVTTDTQVVRTWAVHNDHLRGAAARRLSFDELEREFGEIVPSSESDIMTDAAIRSWAKRASEALPQRETPVEAEAAPYEDYVDTYDGHFVFSPVVRNGRITQAGELRRLPTPASPDQPKIAKRIADK